MPEQDLQSRIDELESQLAFQDELYTQLNQVVARQDRDIERLKTRLEALAEKLSGLGEMVSPGAADPSDEVPPHY